MDILTKLEETLGDLDQLTPEKLNEFLQETVVAFQTMQTKMGSEKEEEREEGLHLAHEFKTAMEEQVQKLQGKLDLDPTELQEFLTAAVQKPNDLLLEESLSPPATSATTSS